jgi:hypothetical protein
MFLSETSALHCIPTGVSTSGFTPTQNRCCIFMGEIAFTCGVPVLIWGGGWGVGGTQSRAAFQRVTCCPHLSTLHIVTSCWLQNECLQTLTCCSCILSLNSDWIELACVRLYGVTSRNKALVGCPQCHTHLAVQQWLMYTYTDSSRRSSAEHDVQPQRQLALHSPSHCSQSFVSCDSQSKGRSLQQIRGSSTK